MKSFKTIFLVERQRYSTYHVNFESMVGLAYIQLVSTILVSILFFSKPNPDQPYLRGAPDSVDELERGFQSLPPPKKINQ